MSTDITPEVRAALSMLGKEGAYASWANTKDRPARTAPARAALEQKWLDMADGDPKRAQALRKLHYLRMARLSAEARRAKKAGGRDAA